MGKPKKGGKKKGNDDWEDDVLNELESLKDGGTEGKKDQAEQPPRASMFEGLEIQEAGEEENEEEDEDDLTMVSSAQKKKKKDKKKKDVPDDSCDTEVPEKDESVANGSSTEGGNSKDKGTDLNGDDFDLGSTSKKSKKGKKSKKDFDLDDLEALEDEVVEISQTDKDSKTSMEEETKKDLGDEEGGEEEDGPIVKTAAQKRAEKKEREKKKKALEKERQKQKSSKKATKTENTTDDKSEEDTLDTAAEGSIKEAEPLKDETPQVGEDTAKEVQEPEGCTKSEQAPEEGDEDAGAEDDKKKKKKKKKKKAGGEEEEKKIKKPNKALVKQMQQQLESLRLEEEKRLKEEEDKICAIEEAEEKRLEKIRLEKERKDKKKQKEKERKARLRQEGKFLTKTQKEQRAKQQAMLEAMKQQGIEIPGLKAEGQEVLKKPVRYGTKKPKNKQQQQQSLDQEDKQESEDVEMSSEDQDQDLEIGKQTEESPESENDKEKEKQEEVTDEPETEEVKDDWDVESGEEDSKDTDEKPVAQESIKEEMSKFIELENKALNPSGELSRGLKWGNKQRKKSEGSSAENEEESESEDSESDDEENEEDSESEDESEEEKVDVKTETVPERIQRRKTEAELNRNTDKLRSPVICVLGHVDTGKTKILDKIRHSHVQDGEAGGITQQIGATMVPIDAIYTQTKMIKEFQDFDIKLPGLLIIDTPGHESFSNLRTRGSSLCDMAILVVDIMHGLEPQTIESLDLLKKKKTPFIVALNKVDRLFEWKRGPDSSIVNTIKKQKRNTKQEFEERVRVTVKEFSEQGLNAALFYDNKDTRSYVSLIPTSAHSGDGMGDLISQVVKLTQTRLTQRLSYSEELEGIILEVKALPGLGTTIDVILINGKLKEGDTLVIPGIEGPIVTQIRALLTPQPLKELRVKNQYINHKELCGAQGVKIAAKDLEKALAGVPVVVANKEDEIEYCKEEVIAVLSDALNAIRLSDRGVYVQSSTLGSLEALVEFLKVSKISYAGVNIGPVHKKDVMKCSIMLEHDVQFAVILAFDVKVEREAQELADSLGVRIFSADIIYHLFDKFIAYREEQKRKRREEFRHIAVFPCKLRILPQHVYNTRDPIVVGVSIEGGILKEGTPVCVPGKGFLDIGIVTGIEANHKPLVEARKGMEACIKIEPTPGDAPKLYGRHFDYEDLVVSKISRQSIDAVKDYFREDLQKSDWQVMIELKKLFQIV